MALGIEANGVARLLATNGVRLVMIGGAIGVAASLLAARFLATLLYGVGRFDPVALIGAPLVLVVAAWLAAYISAASRFTDLTHHSRLHLGPGGAQHQVFLYRRVLRRDVRRWLQRVVELGPDVLRSTRSARGSSSFRTGPY